MNIKVLGWYNHANIGDEAYKVAFPLLFPQHDIEFVEEIESGDASDVVILGGGDIVYPSFTKYISQFSPSTRKIAASISLTENSDFPALQLFDKVFVRDYRSALLCNQSNVNGVYLPDFTFMLTPDPEAGRGWLQEKFDQEGHHLYDTVIVYVVSNYLANAKLDMLARDLTTFMSVSQDMAKVADDINASFVFLPFSTKAPWDDRVACAWVADRCKYYQKNYVVWERLDVQTTLNIIASAKAVVSSRLHGSIFSTISGVPFIDITHHDKNLGFLESIEKTNWSIPFWEFSIKDFRNYLSKFINGPRKDNTLVNFTSLAKEHLRVATIL